MSEPTWTTTRPAGDGWWWFRPVVESVARPVPAKFAVVVCVHSEHGFLWVGTTRPRRLDTIDPRGLWAGPLTPPADPAPTLKTL